MSRGDIVVKDERSRNMILTEERRERILAALQHDGRVYAAALSKEFGVSDDTIRRDLDALAEKGLLQRVHGGALRRLPFTENYEQRRGESAGAKHAIARATVSLLRSGQVILFDGGTTSLAIARQLPKDFTATIITTSPPVAVALAEYSGVEVILIGGRLYRYAQVTVGAEVVERLHELRADVCILGVLALHPEHGLSVRDYDEAAVKRAMIATTPQVIAPTVSEKLGTVATFAVAPTTAITHLITEAGIPDETLGPYRELGLTVLQA
jgi:DeoR/GlpR family transcriptional regulator of sugar metabolism